MNNILKVTLKVFGERYFSYENNVENFTLKHLLLFEKCAREICEKFVYKHSKTIEYVKN